MKAYRCSYHKLFGSQYWGSRGFQVGEKAATKACKEGIRDEVKVSQELEIY